ncbi:LysE family translocator [Kribbella sancticallisti]|uniref:LysE family translocator n=1 Tax=Kribbella sancticallisti TaxID=460087 RepID=A0ABN2DT44_9ACTN
MIVTAASVVGVSLVALGMVLTPGPNMMYLSSRSISQGRRAGLVSLAGVAVGFGCYLVAAAAGLTAILVAVPVAFTVIKLLGAAYLAYLAWQVFSGKMATFETRQLPRDAARRLFLMGLVTNLLNPKIALMYMALIPQFVDPDRGAVWVQALILGGVQIAVALSVNLLIVVGSAALAGFLRARPRWMHVQRWVTGTLLGAFAVKMASSRSAG